MQLELGQALDENCSQPRERRLTKDTTWSRGQPLESQPPDALVGLYSLPWVNGILRDHKRGSGNSHNVLESVQSIIFRWKVLQPSTAALYWAISEASKFLQVSCFQGISGQEFCLPWRFKKRPRARKQGMFCWMQFCQAGGVFPSLQIKSWSTYFAVKSDTQQQTFIKATYFLRETEKVILQYSPRP